MTGKDESIHHFQYNTQNINDILVGLYIFTLELYNTLTAKKWHNLKYDLFLLYNQMTILQYQLKINVKYISLTAKKYHF
jgi:hypothetical protein